jgi:hypothetical protein
VSGQPNSPAALLPGKNHNTHRIGGWVGPRAGIDGFGVQKISCYCQDSNPRPFSPQPVTILTIRIGYPGRALRNQNTIEDEDDATDNAAAPPPNPPTTSTMAATPSSSLFSFLPYLFLLFFSFSFYFFFYHTLCFVFLKVNARNYPISSDLPQPLPSNLLLYISALLDVFQYLTECFQNDNIQKHFLHFFYAQNVCQTSTKEHLVNLWYNAQISSDHNILSTTQSLRITNMNVWCPQFCAPLYMDKGQNRQETIHGCTIKVTKCVSYFTVTQADTGYFPLSTFFIVFPSFPKISS